MSEDWAFWTGGGALLGMMSLAYILFQVEFRLREVERRIRELIDFKGDDGAPL